jgi:hypothetical protein
LNKKKAQSEFQGIEKTEFWKEYCVLLNDERKRASGHCEKDPDVSAWQGAIRAIDRIKNLPDRVLEGKKIKEDTL